VKKAIRQREAVQEQQQTLEEGDNNINTIPLKQQGSSQNPCG